MDPIHSDVDMQVVRVIVDGCDVLMALESQGGHRVSGDVEHRRVRQALATLQADEKVVDRISDSWIHRSQGPHFRCCSRQAKAIRLHGDRCLHAHRRRARPLLAADRAHVTECRHVVDVRQLSERRKRI